jgi:hypothetical protein
MTLLNKVLKELSKHYESKVYISTDPPYLFSDEAYEEYIFYYGKVKKDMNGLEYVKKTIIVMGGSERICFNDCLPPKLTKLVANFYEKGLEYEPLING